MGTLRSFVAIPLTQRAKNQLGRLLHQGASALPFVRWVESENLHITLKFLGDVDDRLLPAVCLATRDALAELKSFEIRFSEVGTYPIHGPARVVWAGLSQGTAELTDMHRAIEEALTHLGLPAESRGYQAHLTLGRVRKLESNEAQIREFVVSHAEQEIGSMLVSQVCVMASVREKGRMTYNAVDTIRL